MGALVPTLASRKGAQIVYASAAGLASSAVLRDVRDRGRAGTSPDMFFVEWGAPPPSVTCDAGDRCTHAKTAVGCGCDKPQYWLMANPAHPSRISLNYIRHERQAMPVDEFCRERMGWWDNPLKGLTPIPLHVFALCVDRGSKIASPVLALGFDVAPDSSSSAVSLAGWRADGLPHAELIEHREGTAWLIDSLTGICERRRPVVVMFDPASPAGAFEKELRNRGFETFPIDKPAPPLGNGRYRMHLMSSRDTAQACGELANLVVNGKIRFPDQSPLTKAVGAGRSRPLSKAWAWDPATGPEAADISPLVAVTYASHGLATFGKKQPLTPFFLT